MRVALSFEGMAICRQLSSILLWRIIPRKSNAKMSNQIRIMELYWERSTMHLELTFGRYWTSLISSTDIFTWGMISTTLEVMTAVVEDWERG